MEKTQSENPAKVIIEEDKGNKIEFEKALDRAKGSIVGAFCGDAIGGPLEFYKGEFTEMVIESAMKMEMVGNDKTIPAQITDDSEMALCILHGLLKVLTINL